MQAPEQPLDILVVAAHPDDAEISVGGTIIRSVREGLHVGVLDLTTGEPTPYGTLERRAAETRAANEILNIAWRHNLGLPNRSMEASLEARRRLAEAFRITRPRLVLTHYWEDLHPDHVAASHLTDAARFWAKLSRTDLAGAPFFPPMVFYYWSIHRRSHVQPRFVIDVSEVMEEKLKAVECYRSQVIDGRPEQFPTVLDDIRSIGRYWGWTIGAAYGEPFAARDQLALDGFRPLLARAGDR